MEREERKGEREKESSLKNQYKGQTTVFPVSNMIANISAGMHCFTGKKLSLK